MMGCSPLLRLSYFDIATMTIPDMMHIVPGVVGAHFFKMIFGNKLTTQLKALQAKQNKAAPPAAASAAAASVSKHRALLVMTIPGIARV
ncbi:hypothetical protein [Silvimonas sp.]|uniref:hypothetical protein n=1 Tax=Silvimonas sp. TaxID=2650811 RepID=UPI0028428E1C|nr:hypothetical protein [Silvimonas sp.]MDR3426059.1 hypothetical protein [Silvimonas sp.]